MQCDGSKPPGHVLLQESWLCHSLAMSSSVATSSCVVLPGLSASVVLSACCSPSSPWTNLWGAGGRFSSAATAERCIRDMGDQKGWWTAVGES